MSSPVGVLRTSDVELIAGFEGFRPWIYDDAHPSRPYQSGTPVEGTLTLGYGDTDPAILKRFENGITKAEALDLLAVRAQQFGDAVLRCLTRTPTPNQFGAMTCLAYNIGTGTAGFCGSTVARRFNAGDIPGAADAFLLWKNGLQPGDLLPRRKAEVAYFLTADSDQPKEIPEMIIISFNGHAYLLSGGVRAQIDRPEQIEQLKAAGVPEVQGNHGWASGFPQGTRLSSIRLGGLRQGVNRLGGLMPGATRRVP